MVSKKVEKYLNKYQERNYAPKQRKIEKSDIREHSHRSSCRQATETSCSDSLQCSGQEQEQQEIIFYVGPEIHCEVIPIITNDDWVRNLLKQGIIVGDQSLRKNEDQLIDEMLNTNQEDVMKKQTEKDKKDESKGMKAYEKKEHKMEKKEEKKEHKKK